VPYFGFLVPTPTQPELAEASDELFTRLEEWTRPEVRTEKYYQKISLMPWMGAALSEPLGRGNSVTVLEEKRVAGYNAVVLKATDAEALRDWMDKHGYDARPAVTVWLEPYIKAGWIITAFQIAKADEQRSDVSTQAVRMSFQTERPFFPYREPSDQRGTEYVTSGRFLRVFLVAHGRMQGVLDDPAHAWTGKAVWAGPLGEHGRDLQERVGAKSVPLPENPWLTVFDDHVSPRPGTADVFFSLSADQSELRRPPIIHYDVSYYPGIDLIVGGVLCLGVGVILPATLAWRSRRRRQQAA
jgi:hypothetical protein